MRNLIIIFSVSLCTLLACRKEPSSLTNSEPASLNLSLVKEFLKDSVPTATFDSLDFSKVVTAEVDSGRTYFVRVPFIGIDVTREFVLVKTDAKMSPARAARFEVLRDTLPDDMATGTFNGSIVRCWLNGIPAYASPVSGGYIQAFHDKAPAVMRADDPYVELPEIVIYASDEDYYADWGLILDEIGGSGGAGYTYSSAAPVSGGGGGAASSSVNSNSFTVANELQASKSAIDLTAYLDCFGNPDPNATYSASLLVRIPNLNNPNIMFNPLTGNVGHTFIQLTKTDGTSSITQYIGFYADCGICAVPGFPVASKLVDNSGHPYDASLTVQLSADQFAGLLSTLQALAPNKYSLSGYNCTGYAVQAFNTILPESLNPPDMAPPGAEPGDFPNSLYEAMEEMPANGIDGKITFYSQDQIAGTGHGPCD